MTQFFWISWKKRSCNCHQLLYAICKTLHITITINDNDNDNDIFIILTGIYIALLHSIISLKLLPSPERLISQFKTNSVHKLCFCEVHA